MKVSRALAVLLELRIVPRISRISVLMTCSPTGFIDPDDRVEVSFGLKSSDFDGVQRWRRVSRLII